MTDVKRSTVLAVFPTTEQAHRAIDELLRAGFPRDDIGFVLRDEQGQELEEQAERYDQKATARTVTGAVTGGVLGGVLGTIAALTIPGIGAVIGAGLFVASTTGAGIIGGLFTGLMSSAGVTDEERDWFEGELKAGRPLVGVRADGRYSEALAILQTHGAYDMTRQKETESAPSGTAR